MYEEEMNSIDTQLHRLAIFFITDTVSSANSHLK